ncbi:MAG TPA: TolC family protein [Thermodesulfobacteriota bacterium]|nr:TolC family protein [Thermodesulfobacteriota bacterium]
MTRSILTIGLLAGLVFSGLQALASETAEPAGTTGPSHSLSLDTFLSEVAQNNLEYAAQRYNVSIAQAQVAKAKVYPNPTLGMGSSLSEKDMPSTLNLGITQTFLTAGKRRAGIEVAQKNYQVAGATLEDFFRNLRAASANAFIDALAAELIVGQKRRSSEALDKLVDANEKRFRAGDLAEIDVTQSRVEALQFHSELLAAESNRQTAVIALSQFLGQRRSSETFIPAGRLDVPARTFVLSELVDEALQKRADVVAAFHFREAARASVQLAKANRFPDVDIGLTGQRTGESTNKIAPSPQFYSLGLSLSIPLPILNTFRAELDMARFSSEQAEKNWQAARLKAEVEIRQAYTRYQSSMERVAKYKGEVLRDATSVLEAKLYSYQRGHTSLLEVLNAQRQENDVYLAYYDTLTEYAKALVALEQAAGIWDVHF